MIEIRCDQTGDTAEADTPEAAFVAAKTLCEDAWNANANQGYRPTVTFIVDGKPLVSRVPESEFWKVAA